MGSFSNSDVINIIERAKLLGELNHGIRAQRSGQETWCTTWSPDGAYFAWSCGNRVVKIITWIKNDSDMKGSVCLEHQTSGQDLCYRQFECSDTVWSVEFLYAKATHSAKDPHFHILSKTKDLVAIGLASGRIHVWDLHTGKLVLDLVDHRSEVVSLKFSPYGSVLVSASRDGTVKIWDMLDDGNMTRTLRLKRCRWFNCVAWSPKGKILAAVGHNKTVLLYDATITTKPILMNDLVGHHHDVRSCDFSPDGALLATASYDTRIILFNVYTADVLQEFNHMYPPPRPIFASGQNDNFVRSLSFSQDGVHIASVCDDGYIRMWEITEKQVPKMICQVDDAKCCSFNPSGTILSVGTGNGNVMFFSTPKTVESLQHSCRMTILRQMDSDRIDGLNLPALLKQFLKYN